MHMTPWWAKPPEPKKEPEPVPAAPEEDVVLSQHKLWRLRELLRTLREVRPDEPVSLDEVDHLWSVADGYEDLHDACNALRHGCEIDKLARIYT
jgi:hypothetical protein